MAGWYVVGLFESSHSVKSQSFGYVCVWAKVKGPFRNKTWADQANSLVDGDTAILYKGAKWKCVYSCVSSEFDLKDYGLQGGEQVNGQLVLPGLSEVL